MKIQRLVAASTLLAATIISTNAHAQAFSDGFDGQATLCNFGTAPANPPFATWAPSSYTVVDSAFCTANNGQVMNGVVGDDYLAFASSDIATLTFNRPTANHSRAHTVSFLVGEWQPNPGCPGCGGATISATAFNSGGTALQTVQRLNIADPMERLTFTVSDIAYVQFNGVSGNPPVGAIDEIFYTYTQPPANDTAASVNEGTTGFSVNNVTDNDLPAATSGESCSPATVAADCRSGNPTQNAGASCNAGQCVYPRLAITSCTAAMSGGQTIANCTPLGGGDLQFDLVAGKEDFHGTATATYTTAAGTATVNLEWLPVTDPATVSHGNTYPCAAAFDTNAEYCLNEDQFPAGIDLDLSVALGDVSTPDPAETIYYIDVDNVPEGGTLICGNGLDCGTATNCSAGFCDWNITPTGASIPPGALPISMQLPEDYATFTGGPDAIQLRIRARTDDGAAAVCGAGCAPWEDLFIEIREDADSPTVTVDGVATPSAFVSGLEDTTIPLLLGVQLEDTDGSEQLVVQVLNVPADASLTHGTLMGGVYTVNPADVPNLGISWDNPSPDHSDTNFDLIINVQAQENWSFSDSTNPPYPAASPLPNSSATTSVSLNVQVNAVADPIPTLNVSDATTDEDTPVQLDMSAMLVDMDGSETMTFSIDSFGAATFTPAGTAGPGTTRIFTAAQAAAGIMYNPIAHSDDDVQIRIDVITTEARSTCSISGAECVFPSSCGAGGQCLPSPQASTGPEYINITIDAVADTPSLSVPTSVGPISEGASTDLSALTATHADNVDGSETCVVTITWDLADFVEPEMVGDVMFNRGSAGAPGSWTVNCSETGTGFRILPPANGHGTIEFCAQAETEENANNDTANSGAPDCFNVTINNTNEVCSDGFEDPSEDCDTGSANANAPNTCRTDCTDPACGDGIFDNLGPWGPDGTGEECDAGAGNSDVQPDTCRTDCRLPYCGDNVEDMFEACDDGNNGIQTDSCLDGCLAATCGDGFVWTDNEECDNGLANSDTTPDACRTTCVLAGCTDGVLDTGEACDDGNQNDGDACPSSCQDATCGDGFTFIGMEECDQGANNSDIQPDTCRTSCDLPGCGDTVVDTGEECDDGNTVNEDICVNTCELNVCGDGFVDLQSEECDEGADNSNSEPDTCRPGCVNPSCGDGVVDSGESCDLGPNNNDNDPNGCKTNCALPGCGDGVVGPGEQCDDGANNSNTDPDACRETCTLARCGDGVLDTGEVCDDGPANSNQVPNVCRTTCILPGCGDGVVDTGETCDNGALNSDTTPGACRTSCVVASCGDGVVDPGETCDDGANNSDTDAGACRTTCVVASCGDGVIDPGEVCDDGAANGTMADGCQADCTLPPECGDGFIDEGEECDDGALNSDDEADACRTDCTNAICGDGVVDTGEECDAGAEASDTCDSDCVIIDGGDDMGMGGDDMGMNNANNTTPDMGDNNANNGTGDDMGGEADMGGGGNNGGGGGTTPAEDDGCCRTVRRAEGDSGVAGWLAMVALGLIALRRRR